MDFISRHLETITDDDKENFYIAPDESLIRKFPDGEKGGMAFCELPAKKISKAVKHQTVEELWYCVDGKGKFWRKINDDENVLDVEPGMYLTIPVGAHFQFKNETEHFLKFLITTIPCWPGPTEAISVDDYWKVKT